MTSTTGTLLLLVLPALTIGADFSSGPPKADKQTVDRQGDPLPPGALMRLGSVRFRHQAAVVQVAFSADGKRLASASLDGTVRVWDSSTGKELWRFPAHSGLLEFPFFGGTLAFSADGKTLAQARYGAHLWDLASGKEIQHPGLFSDDQPYDAAVGLHFATNGKIQVAINRAAGLRLVDALTAKELRTFEKLERANFVCLSPDGRTLIALQRDNQSKETLHFYEVATGKERQPAEKIAWCHTVLFAPDGKSLAISSNEGVRLLEWPSCKEMRRWEGYAGALAFSADGKTLVAGSNRTVHLWNTATGEKLRSFSCFQWIQSVALSPDGKTLAVGSGSYMHRLHPADDQCGGVIQLWDTTTGQRLGPQESHQDVALCVAYAPDGKTLASGGRDRTVRLWDPVTGKSLAVLQGHDEDVFAVAFSPGGKLLASGSRDKTVCVWDPTTGQRIHQLKHEGSVYAVAWALDGALLAVADTNSACVWDVKTGKRLHQWKREKGSGIYAVAFAPDGKTLAFAGGQRVFLPDNGDNDIYLVDPATGQEKGKLPGNKGNFAVCSLAYSPDGALLACGCMNPYLHVWQPATGKLLHNINTRTEGTVTFSADGKLLVSSGPLSDTVHLFDPTTGKQLREMPTGQGGVYAAALAPDSTALASAGQDGTILIWNLLKMTR